MKPAAADVIRLYRSLHRALASFPFQFSQSKMKENLRLTFRLRRHMAASEDIAIAYDDGMVDHPSVSNSWD